MSSILPCLSEHDSCRKPQKCMYRRHVDAGIRDATWVAEHKCDELKARKEGWQEVGE